MTKNKTVSLIVCTVGRQSELIRLFDSIYKQSYQDIEIVLIDQNSSGFLDDIVDQYKSKLKIKHKSSPLGLSLGRNIGIENVSGDIVGFPDDDCWYSSSVVEDIVKEFSSNNIDVLLGRTLDSDGIAFRKFNYREGPIRVRSEVFSVGDSNGLFVSSSAIRLIGNFNEELGVGSATRYQSGEESEFILRALDRKLCVWVCPDVCVFHERIIVLNESEVLKRARNYSLGFGRVCRLQRIGLIFTFTKIARAFGSSLLHFMRGNFEACRLSMTWAKGAFSGYASGRRR